MGVAIIAYAISVWLGAALNPSRLFSFVLLPTYVFSFGVQYAGRRFAIARQLERDARQAQLAQQVLRQLPAAGPSSNGFPS
jgi:hypothetical protein